MKRKVVVSILRSIAFALPGRAGFDFLRYARRNGWATWREIDQLDT